MTTDKQMLIMITGLPGTGKTTFAQALASRLSIPHFNTDILRTELGWRGRYDDTTKKAIYDKLLQEVKAKLQTGTSVIVDATFYKASIRKTFDELGSTLGLPVVWIEMRAADLVVKQRVGKRRLHSEADYAVYLCIRKLYEPISQRHLTLWSDQMLLSEMLAETIDYLKNSVSHVTL